MRNSNIFKIELKRAFKSRKLLIALLAGMIIAVWHYVQYVLPLIRAEEFEEESESETETEEESTEAQEK